MALGYRKVVGIVYIDFQKAFDTVSHEILMYKLQAMGLNRDLLNWILSYLTNRKQFSVVNGCRSQTKEVSCGVQQGSLLGPRLFMCYINNLCDSVTEENVVMYADDTTLFYIGNSADEVADSLNRSLNEIHTRCKNDKFRGYDNVS